MRLALVGINTVHHVMGDREILVAGTSSGLLLRRTLNLLGVTDNAGREALDAAAMAESANASGIAVSGAHDDNGTLRIAVDTDASSPAGLWLAVLAHGTQEVDELLDAMAAEVGPLAETWSPAGGQGRVRFGKQGRRHFRLSGLPPADKQVPSAPPCSLPTPPRLPTKGPPPETPPRNSPTNPERKEEDYLYKQ